MASVNLIVDFPESPRQQPERAVPSSSRTRVAFQDLVDVKFVENLSIKYKTELWFSGREMKMFKYETAFHIRTIDSHNLTMAQYAEMNVRDTSVFMGLEVHLTKDTARNIVVRRRALWTAVRAEQQRQSKAGICDPAQMASVAKMESEVSSKRAQIIALIHSEKC